MSDTLLTKPQVLQTRLITHTSTILNMSSKLTKTLQANHVSRQLVRSGTAAAANYGEARGAESRSDFIHKLRIVLKELNETPVRLQLILENTLLSAEHTLFSRTKSPLPRLECVHCPES
jgi:four helix bundle protein